MVDTVAKTQKKNMHFIYIFLKKEDSTFFLLPANLPVKLQFQLLLKNSNTIEFVFYLKRMK